jgi:hypothetical protein
MVSTAFAVVERLVMELQQHVSSLVPSSGTRMECENNFNESSAIDHKS